MGRAIHSIANPIAFSTLGPVHPLPSLVILVSTGRGTSMHEDDPTTGQVTSDGDQQQTVKANETAAGLLAPGERVGRYVVRERLGEGGFQIAHPHATATFTTAPASSKIAAMSRWRLTLQPSHVVATPARTHYTPPTLPSGTHTSGRGRVSGG